MYPFEFEIDQDTKDMLDDLLTKYPNHILIIKRAVEALHEKHFGSSDSKEPLPTFDSSIKALDDKSI